MTEKIDVATVFNLMDEIIAEFGEDYVYMDHYDSCRYTNDDGTPACIVGQVLAKVGLPLPDYNSARNGVAWIGSYDDKFSELWENFTDDANNALRAAQAVQDGDFGDTSATWADAVAHAKKVA